MHFQVSTRCNLGIRPSIWQSFKLLFWNFIFQVFIMSFHIMSRQAISTIDSRRMIIFFFLYSHLGPCESKQEKPPDAHAHAIEALPLIEFVTAIKASGLEENPSAFRRQKPSRCSFASRFLLKCGWIGPLGLEKVILQLPRLIHCQIQYYLLQEPLGQQGKCSSSHRLHILNSRFKQGGTVFSLDAL